MRFAEGSRRWADGGTAGSLKAPEDRPAAVVQTWFNLHTGHHRCVTKDMAYSASSANQILHEMQLSETQNPARDATQPGKGHTAGSQGAVSNVDCE